MGFVDPRTDFGFKRIFGSTRSKPILRSFLNAIVYDNQPRITDLEIIDPYQNPDLYGLKQSILDVKAVLDDETIVIIEMQVSPVESFTERTLYNAAKAYVSQLKRGEGYMALKPVICLNIIDFLLFPKEDTKEGNPISRYKLLDAHTGRCCSHHIELIFAELPKLSKEPEGLDKHSELWLYFIQQAGRVESVPEVLAGPEFDEAFEIANESQLSPEEYEIAEKERMKIWDKQGARAYALREGREKGIAEGRAKGREEGIEIGMEQGSEAKAREIARADGVTRSLEGIQRGDYRAVLDKKGGSSTMERNYPKTNA